jgi:hypothetical protein
VLAEEFVLGFDNLTNQYNRAGPKTDKKNNNQSNSLKKRKYDNQTESTLINNKHQNRKRIRKSRNIINQTA